MIIASFLRSGGLLHNMEGT